LRTPVVVALAAVLSLLLAPQAFALLLGVAGPASSAAPTRQAHVSTAANMATLPAGSSRFLRTGQVEAIPDYNWYPGYYVLNHIDTAARKQLILDDPLVEPFTGVQFRYHWAASELSPGDYSAGFATLDADLERVAAKGKKIMVMLVYKESDGTSAVPADLRTGPGAWCSGPYCGELTNGAGTSLALLWNPVVEARLKAWIAAMALHLSESTYIDNVAGILFNETTLGTTDTTVLASANYDPDVYIQALKDNMLAATTAASRLITILYFEGGFVSMDGSSVRAGQKIGDWMLLNPRMGAGTPDLKPKSPKGTNHPCANSKYQSYIACAPAVQAPDYSTQVTDSFDQSFNYATDPVPDGLHASFFTFSYAVGAGPNAFTFADVSNNIATHPIPNTARPWPVNPVASPPVANHDSASTNEGTTVTINVATNDTDPDGDLNPASANTTCPTCATPTNGALVNNGNGSFNYTPNLTFNGSDGFVYEICDTQSACDTASVNINVGNQPPQITSSGGGDTASVSAAENQTSVTTVTATDADNQTLTFAISGGVDQAAFTIVPATGVLTFLSAPDLENPTDAGGNNVYDVLVEASDGSLSDAQAIAVTVTDVNEGGNSPPVITSDAGGPTASVSAAENQTAVTDVDASDPDVGDTLDYSITGGLDMTSFTIVPSTGVLNFLNAPNFELPTDTGGNNVYDVTVQVSDGHGGLDSQALAVTVTNVNEFAPVISSDDGGASASVSKPENQTAVTDVNATDGDLQTPTYAISGGVDQAAFTIVPATGVLTFQSAPNFEAPTDVGANNTYEVVVSASDGSLSDTQTITVTVTDVVESAGSPLYFSLLSAGTVGGVSVADEDVVLFDGTNFSLAFDGSDVGISAFRIDAFSWVSATSLLLSFDGAGAVPGIAGTTDDSDIVLFTATSLGDLTAGVFSLYFDGSDVGLTTTGEDVDAVELLPGGHILISTVNSVAVTGAAGEDEDLLEFAPTTLGATTAGTFTLYFDGSDVGLTASGEDVDAAAVDATGKIYLSTLNNFAVTGISGADEDVFVFTPSSLGSTTAGTYSSTLYFAGSLHGLSANDVLAIDLP